MSQQKNVFLAYTGKRPILFGVGVLCIIIISCCVIFKKYIKTHGKNYTSQTLTLPKLNEDEDNASPTEEESAWKTITTKSGDTLGSLFRQVGLSQKTLQNVLNKNKYAKNLANIKPNQTMRFLIEDNILEKLIFPLDATQYLLVYRDKDNYLTKIKERDMESHNQYVTATIKGSLYSTAKRMNISYKLIQQMVDIFNWEFDFAKEVRQGDQFSMVYNAFYIDDSLVKTGEILAVIYESRGQVHQAVLHVNADGSSNYYTPEGNSLKKAFSRYPLQFSHISSTFSLSRYHPVLHYRRAHKGVDLAAPIGTPIHATGDGRIEIIGRQNDYGNMIKLNHNKTYSTVYGHLLRFQKGLSRGDTVKRGQIIGYVGQSGLATGPHCHYEFHINHQPKNPTTIKLPMADPISSREKATFHAKTKQLIASLELYKESYLAAAKSKKAVNTG